METIKLNVKGMHCPSCKMLIEEALEDEGCTDITISLDTKKQEGKISCQTDLSKQEIVQIIQAQGDYTAK